ncbi:hypothetical protein IV203_009823 [Nitzschia inconspicua]|uniref:Uncharacterized protein n=1 Tax=Nitzschia inconspicua TaxID=303405 RepID=A0A9K3KWJ0_9STRA|nr:hypothetical protein IV203_009823 [Nitzschia inconspicua]
MNSIGGYFGALRWKAANVLTSTLPEEEKNQLLEKLGGHSPLDARKNHNHENDHDDSTAAAISSTNINKEEEEEEDASAAAANELSHSIEEAIAYAKAQEAARYEERWEEEKEALIAEAEEAARRRIQSDLEIQRRQLAFEAWKKNLEKETQQQQEQEQRSTAAAATTTTNESSLSPSLSISSTQPDEAILRDHHPILGPVVTDLGSKRIHLVPSRALAAIPVWKKQRIYRHDRAKSMAKDKLKTLNLGLPGVIGVFEAKDGSLKIIDGQHRIGMLKVLEEKAAADHFDFDKILVEVYPQMGDQKEDVHARDLFIEVNKAEPVKLVDLPGVAKASDRKVINEGADRLMDKYPDMFSPSQRCRAPHLNIDNLRDALFASNAIQRNNIKTPKALEHWMMGQNELMASKFQVEENRRLVPESALKKAEKYDFYLGLDSTWLYN